MYYIYNALFMVHKQTYEYWKAAIIKANQGFDRVLYQSTTQMGRLSPVAKATRYTFIYMNMIWLMIGV